MNKRIYLAIIWIITLLVIVFVSAGKFNIIKVHWHFNSQENEKEYFSDDDVKKYSNGIDENLEAFSNIRINANVLGITIKEGDKYHISASFNKTQYMPEFTIVNDTLKILQDIPKHNNTNVKCNLEVTVPAGKTIEDINIDLNVGEICLKNSTADEINVKNNVGEISIKNTNFKELKAETNVGEIGIEVIDNVDDYNIDASTDIGEIRISGKSYKRKYSQKSDSGKKIKVETNVGEVKIN